MTARVRRSVYDLPAGDQTVEWYSAAVAELQNRPLTDPTSWWWMGAVHGQPGFQHIHTDAGNATSTGMPITVNTACDSAKTYTTMTKFTYNCNNPISGRYVTLQSLSSTHFTVNEIFIIKSTGDGEVK